MVGEMHDGPNGYGFSLPPARKMSTSGTTEADPNPEIELSIEQGVTSTPMIANRVGDASTANQTPSGGTDGWEFPSLIHRIVLVRCEPWIGGRFTRVS